MSPMGQKADLGGSRVGRPLDFAESRPDVRFGFDTSGHIRPVPRTVRCVQRRASETSTGTVPLFSSSLNIALAELQFE